jgi:hypothetical protein
LSKLAGQGSLYIGTNGQNLKGPEQHLYLIAGKPVTGSSRQRMCDA